MSYNYIVTAHKGTAVVSALTGCFTGPEDLNLIQARGSSLVISLATAEGLKPVLDIDIFGRITHMQLFRPPGEFQDLLFLLTARYHVAVLSYDADSRDVVTRAYGNVKDSCGKPTQGRQIALIDPQCRVTVLHLYSGLLKVVPLELDSAHPLKAFNVRMEDLFVIDMQFLHGCEMPTLVYLCQEQLERVMKSSCVSVRDKELVPGPWKPVTVENQASLLWAVPGSIPGMLVIGAETIAFYSADVKVRIDPPAIKESIISCIGTVDRSRYLLGDHRGRLLMLFLEFQDKAELALGTVTDLRLEVLGEITIPTCVSYLDNGVVFIGSTRGDSQLVKLNTSAGENGSFVEVMENMTNIGPILDMSIVDLDKQGRDVLVCCSGYDKDGSLRIVKSGVGINEAASIDLGGIKGIWSLHCGTSGDLPLDNTIILSFVGQTTALSLSGEEVEETEIAGLATDQETFYCSNITGERIIQITSKSVRIVNEETLDFMCDWHPPSGCNITSATCNDCQVLVAVGRDLYYLEVGPSELVQVSHTTMDHEVACVDISPLGGSEKAALCAIGLWTDISVQLLTIPGLEKAFTQPLGGDIIPRSVLMVKLGEVYYLLCALGDGCLYYYVLDYGLGQLKNGKRVILGTKPVILRLFQSSGVTNVFACSDHPTIIHSTNHKLLFSNVNVKEVNYMCTLNSEAYRDSLALVDGSSLVIGSVDQIQMLHIETIPMGESVRRIAYQESTQTFLVASFRFDVMDSSGKHLEHIRKSASTQAGSVAVSPPISGSSKYDPSPGEEIETHSLLLMDQTTFDISSVYQLTTREHALSVQSCTLRTTRGEEKTVYVVGTAIVLPNQSAPENGRILLFQVVEGKLELLSTLMVDGAAFQVLPFNGKILASVNSFVRVYKCNNDMSLEEECSHSNNILALYLKTKGDFILVGDILKSLKLLVYKHEQGLEEIGVDLNVHPCYCTGIEMMDDENYLAADGRHVFICQKNTEAVVESEMIYMLQPARMYIGDNINVFGRGSLVMDHPGSSPALLQSTPILYGTVHGAIGLICQLSLEMFELLSKLQQTMASSIKSVGNIEHEVFRSFVTEHKTKAFAGFIDGDLVEKFLDLPRSQMEEITKGIKTLDGQNSDTEISLEEILKVVEDLSRLH